MAHDKLLKTCKKEKILETARGETDITYRNNITNLSSEAMQGNKTVIFKVMKEENFQPRNIIQK